MKDFNDRVAAWLVANRKWLMVASFAVLAVLGYGGKNLYFESDYKIFFKPDNPQLKAYERIQETFSKDDGMTFIIAPDDGDVFTNDTLRLVEELTEFGWQMPTSSRVDSLTNYQHTYAEGDDLIVVDLVDDAATATLEQRQEARSIALAEPILRNNMVAAKGDVTAVQVTFEMSDNRLDYESETVELVKMSREKRDEMEAKYPGHTIYLMGVLIVNTAFNENSIEDMGTLIPAMYLLTLVLLLLFFRSWASVLVTLTIVGISTLAAEGAAGWLGIPLNQVNISAPVVIMTLAVCDSVHLLILYLRNLGRGFDKAEAMTKTLSVNMQPVFLTSFTTAIGFVSLNFADSPPIAEMGNVCALGVIAAWIFTLTVLPGMMMALPAKGRKDNTSEGGNEGGLQKLAGSIIGHPVKFLIGSVSVALVLIAGMPRNELNDNTIQYFHKGVPFRTAADFMQENLTGFDNIMYELSCGQANCVNDPEFLAKVDEFADWYDARPETTHIDVFTRTMKRLNRVMNNDDPAFYKIPESRDLAAQYHLLYEFSLPFGLDLGNQMSFDKSALRLNARIADQSAQEIIDLEAAAQEWFDTHAPELKSDGSSISLMFAHIGQRTIYSMLSGTALAILLISATLILALRSFKFGLLSLIPNAFPAAMAFGIWGYTMGYINMSIAAVFSITLGIVVDDTVHFLSKYLRARRVAGKTTEESIRYAFDTVGAALMVTSIALAAGFAILGLSDFDVNSAMGNMVAMTIMLAVVFDLLFLPALLMLVDRKKTAPAA
jgi:predicted RND superfamily exporter protein